MALTEQPIQGEIETKASGVMAPSEPFPGIYRLDEAKHLTETDDYRISDIHYETQHGWTYWTTIDVTLKPKKQSYYFQFSVHQHYTITKGTLVLVIGTQTRMLHEHDMIAVPSGKHHMLINVRETDDSSYVIQVPAKLDLREYLGTVYDPYPTKEQETRRAKPPTVSPVSPITIPAPPFPGAKVVP